MAILIGPNTKVICQGLTGRTATYHTERMIAYGTDVVAGVTPGKGGRRYLDRPIFDTVSAAAQETGANASILFVPPVNAAAAMIEAIEAGLELLVAVTERIPVHDMLRVKAALAGSRCRLVGPNSQGVLAPGLAQLGVMSTVNARPGSIGVASRSASLTSEVVAQLTAIGLGQSTTVGVGGDPVHGLSLADCVELFDEDPGTTGIVLIGEIGGDAEERAAAAIKSMRTRKPVVALVVGANAPPEKRMGHAGALVAAERGTASRKLDTLAAAGVTIAPRAHLVGETMRALLVPRAAAR